MRLPVLRRSRGAEPGVVTGTVRLDRRTKRLVGRLRLRLHARRDRALAVGFVMLRAVLFDVDFTLCRPGPELSAERYARIAARHGAALDVGRYDNAREAAIRAGPPDEGLHRGDLATRQVDDRLVVDDEFAALHRTPQVCPEPQSIFARDVHRRLMLYGDPRMAARAILNPDLLRWFAQNGGLEMRLNQNQAIQLFMFAKEGHL